MIDYPFGFIFKKIYIYFVTSISDVVVFVLIYVWLPRKQTGKEKSNNKKNKFEPLCGVWQLVKDKINVILSCVISFDRISRE